MSQLEKGYFQKVPKGETAGSGTEYPVMFNPAELSVKKTVPWNAQPQSKQDTPKQEFTAGQARTISMKLEYDTSWKSDGGTEAERVLPWVNNIASLANVDTSLSPPEPPNLSFAWGSELRFTCVIKSCNITFTRFNPNGVPIRANMQLELVETFLEVWTGTNTATDSGGSVSILTGKQTPQDISGENWQADAEFNNIDNPRDVPAGTPYGTS